MQSIDRQALLLLFGPSNNKSITSKRSNDSVFFVCAYTSPLLWHYESFMFCVYLLFWKNKAVKKIKTLDLLDYTIRQLQKFVLCALRVSFANIFQSGDSLLINNRSGNYLCGSLQFYVTPILNRL